MAGPRGHRPALPRVPATMRREKTGPPLPGAPTAPQRYMSANVARLHLSRQKLRLARPPSPHVVWEGRPSRCRSGRPRNSDFRQFAAARDSRRVFVRSLAAASSNSQCARNTGHLTPFPCDGARSSPRLSVLWAFQDHPEHGPDGDDRPRVWRDVDAHGCAPGRPTSQAARQRRRQGIPSHARQADGLADARLALSHGPPDRLLRVRPLWLRLRAGQRMPHPGRAAWPRAACPDRLTHPAADGLALARGRHRQEQVRKAGVPLHGREAT